MKTIKLDLSGGCLALGPLLVATIRDNADAIAAAKTGTLPEREMLELTNTLALACAQRVDPAFSQARLDKILDMENFGQVYAACFGVSIPVMPELPPGGAVAVGNPSMKSIGTASSVSSSNESVGRGKKRKPSSTSTA